MLELVVFQNLVRLGWASAIQPELVHKWQGEHTISANGIERLLTLNAHTRHIWQAMCNPIPVGVSW